MKTFTHPNYELDEKIGEGGMSVVYLAEHKAMRRPVAIKFLRQEFMVNDNIRKRFISEGRNMFAMDHPNIVRVYDLIETSEYVAIVMEYVAGVTLKSYLERYGAMEEEDLNTFFGQMLSAVGYIHSKGYIHRDIKPSNFMVTAEGTVKLFDFGIAKSLGPESQEHTATGTSQVLGTPLYMSPEQVKESHAVTPLTDIYSLGVVLWQMVTGKRPYGDSLATFELQMKIVNEPLAASGTRWDPIVSRACIKEPTKRFRNCAEFQKAMEEAPLLNDLQTKVETKESKTKAPKVQEVKKEKKSTSYLGIRPLLDTLQEQSNLENPPQAAIQPEVHREDVKAKTAETKLHPGNENVPVAPEKKSSRIWYVFFFILSLGGLGIFLAESGLYDKWMDQIDPEADVSQNSEIESLEANMVFIPGGTFTMGCTSEQGSDCESDEKPAHRVTVSDFYIGKYEVTQKEWQEVMGGNPSNFKNCEDCPVESVSWDDVQEFLAKLNAKTGKTYRLPTEAEWEYAARGGSQRRGYKYAGSNRLDEVAWYDGNSGDKTHPVGQKKANELGLYDISGNVWEWCSDWYDDYPSTAQTNPKGPSTGSDRVLRGGSWYFYAEICRSAHRGNYGPDFRGNLVGFRLVFVP